MSDIKHIFQLPEAGRDFDDDALYVGRLGTSPQNRRLPIRSLVGASVRLDWEDALDLDEYGDDLTVFVEGDGGAVSWSGDLQDGRRLTVVNECAGELEVFGEVVPVGGSVSAVWVDGVRGAWLGGGLTPDSVGMVELKTEVKDKLPPPSVFFPTDEASLLEALAADGVRTIIMSQQIILTDNTIPIGSGVCNLNTHDGGGVSTLVLDPTNSTATTLTGDGAVIYVDGDLPSLGFVLNGVEIYCKRMSVGGDRTVTATTTEKLYYERMVAGSLTGAVEQLYWSNTYTPQPETIGTAELTPAVVNRLSPTSTAFVSTVPQFLTALSDATIKEIRVTEHITATSQALEINGDKQIYGTLTIDGTTTTSGDGYPHFNDPLTLGGTLTTVKEWRCTRVSGTVSVTGSLVYEWTDGTVTGGVQAYWLNTNDSSGGGGGSVITTKGDLIVGDASGNEARLPIGANGQSLIVKDNTAKWGGLVIPTFNVSTQTELADAMRTATPNNIMHINVTAPITTNAGMSDYATPDKPIRRDCTYIFSGQRIKLGYGGWNQQGTGGPYNSKLIFLCELEYNHSGVSGGRPDTPRGKVWAKILYGEDSGSDLNIESDYPHKVQKFVQRSKNVTGEISQATFDLQYDPTNQSVQIKELESDSIYNGHLSNKAVTGAKIADNTVTPTQTYGASGSFTDPDGKIVTVTNGLITSIV